MSGRSNSDIITTFAGLEASVDIRSGIGITIRITCPCDLYTLTPHFYIVKLGCTGVYIFFLFLL